VDNQKVNAAFTDTIILTPDSTIVVFENESTNASSYYWNFGDSSFSTLQNPTHAYTDSGTYTVTLKDSGLNGISTISKIINISFNPLQSGNWVKRTQCPGEVRCEAVSFVIGNTAYIGTGYDGSWNTCLNDFWSYDTLNGWIQLPPFPGAARKGAVAFTVNGKGYITLGTDGYSKFKDTWEYNPTTNEWVQKANFGGTARYGSNAFGIGNYGYVTCGFDGTYQNDLWQYDPSLDIWTQKTSIGGQSRMFATSFINNNQGYVVSGLGSLGNNLNDFWKYDPTTDSWTAMRNIYNYSTQSDFDYTDIIRNSAVAIVMGGKAYLAVGVNGGLNAKTWQYDFATDRWTRKSSFERSAREGAVAFTINGRGFVSSGQGQMSNNNTPLYFFDLEEWQPNVFLNLND